MRYEDDGTGTREMRVRVRVQSELGLRKVGQLVFDYNAANERLEILSVHVIKSDGTVVTAGPDSIQDLSAPVTREAPMYTDARQKHVTVPGLSVGDVLEYDTVTTIFEPLTPGQFWETWELVGDAICLDEQVDLNVPKNRVLKLKIPAGVAQTTHDEGDRRVYHWATSTLEYPGAQELLANLQAGARRFDFARALEGPPQPPSRKIMFSTFQSWDEIARWYEGLERDRRAVTPDIQAKADEIVKGVSSDSDKAQALYQWVSANIRYVSLSFGVGRYQPHAAAEILANRYGDCKDKATLLAALMQAEGLHANTVLIDSRADVDPDVPSPLQFDHAITYAKIAGQDVWLDSTIGVGPFGYLLPQLRGKNALVADSASEYVLRKTPADLAIPRVYQVQLRSAAPVDGKRTIHISFDTRGDMEVLLRLGFIQLPAGQMTALINQGMKAASTASHGGDAEMEAVKTSDPTDTRKPFHIEADMVVTTEANASSSSSSGTSSSATPFAREAELAQMLSYALPAAPERQNEDQNKSASDEKPLLLSAPEEISLTVDVSTDQVQAQPPVHTHLSEDFATFENDVAAQGQNYHATWRLVLNSREVPPAKLEDYRAFRQDVLAALNTGVSAAVGAPSAEAAELYSRAEEDMQRRNWTAGAAGMAQVIRIDPKFGYAWYELGRARMNTGEYPNAEIAYRKYVELEPKNRLANQGLAWVLAVEGKYGDVTKLLEPFVTDNPADADMLGRLGGAYLQLPDYPKAAAAFEKAAALEPKNANTQVSLGRAYLGAGQNDKGVAAFQKAVSLDDSALTLNNAAYYMGDGKVQMQLALQWSTRAVQHIENQLNDLTLPTIQSSNGQLTLELAEYWDTLAWIEYRSGNLPAAEKYARAGWELANVIAIGSHLGAIYQAEGLKPQAITAFAQTLALSPKNRQPSEDEREARKQLVALLGSDAAANDRIQQESANLETRRNVQVENSAKLVGSGQFIMIVGPGSAITDIESASPDNPLVALTDSVRAIKLLQTFPDETLRKLPEAGTLVCSSADQPCTFTPLPPIPSSRVFPRSAESSSN